MRNQSIVNRLIILALLTLFLTSCNTTEKDWRKAKTANSKIEYQKFISKHASSIQAKLALKILDSMELASILNSHDADSLQLFLSSHTDSEFLLTSKAAMDSLEWNIAFYSGDTVRLRKYSEKYPENVNSVKARKLIWKIQWPPATDDLIGMVLIWKDGFSDIINLYQKPQDQCLFTNGIPFDGFEMTDNHVVFIWRNFTPNELKKVNKLGLKPGIAYLKTKNGYEFIKNVDLNKSDEDLRAEFEYLNSKLSGTKLEYFFGVSQKNFEEGRLCTFHNYKNKNQQKM
jgi:hypothetical protein